MYAWEVRDTTYRRIQELLPYKSDYFYKTLAAFLCYKNCLAGQLYVFGTSSDFDKSWVRDRSFRYMKKVMLDWCDMKGIKDDVYPRRNELVDYLFDIHPALLEHHYYLYQIDYSYLAERIGWYTSSSAINNYIAARSLCSVLFNLEEYHYIWGDGDVLHHLGGRLNFYNGLPVQFYADGLRGDPGFWDALHTTMGYYREKYHYYILAQIADKMLIVLTSYSRISTLGQKAIGVQDAWTKSHLGEFIRRRTAIAGTISTSSYDSAADCTTRPDHPGSGER